MQDDVYLAAQQVLMNKFNRILLRIDKCKDKEQRHKHMLDFLNTFAFHSLYHLKLFVEENYEIEDFNEVVKHILIDVENTIESIKQKEKNEKPNI